MKTKILVVVVLAILLIAAVLYFNNDLGLKNTANAVESQQLTSACGTGPEANWEECQNFIDEVLEASRASTDRGISDLRAQIFDLSQQISALMNAQ